MKDLLGLSSDEDDDFKVPSARPSTSSGSKSLPSKSPAKPAGKKGILY